VSTVPGKGKMSGRAWFVRATAVAAMSGAAFALPIVTADARPDPVPGFPAIDYHDCSSGTIFEPSYYDDGPVTDVVHHNVEPLLKPALGDYAHYGVSCLLLARFGL
jgi:hypothetical protein